MYRFALHSTGSSDPTLKNSISASCTAMASGSALSDINALPCPCAGVTAVYAPRCGQPLGCGLAALAVTAAALPWPLPLRCASLLCHAVQFRTSCSTHRQMHLWSSCGSMVIWKAAKHTKCMLCGSETNSAADGEVAGYAPGTLAVSCAVSASRCAEPECHIALVAAAGRRRRRASSVAGSAISRASSSTSIAVDLGSAAGADANCLSVSLAPI